MEFNASYFHAFGNPDFAAVFSDGSAQALRPNPSAGDGEGASVKAEKGAAVARPTANPSSVTFVVPDEELGEAHHFLNECSRCHKGLTGDIFMYRGDTPFCSEECRRKQIETEKARHRRKKQNSPKAQAQAAAAAAAAAERESAPQVRRPQPQ
ncbi:hypothetical protein CFC21_084029 [Triticum aestivum]|uniref:FLZ-type domain-containing protein n=2 Tax=Triticum aestivum TaxID=4565 RepID=A0A9R1L6V1_WHEAT|nr:FCS-Like Zinc finger 6-like [Triticum dicoccoides]XP_044406547.1 FCS-Like Zinc finger 6-like [Triticum aestivum]KAF7079856.1 hypothetical protein CFC21_084029 [Triticum aestivum]